MRTIKAKFTIGFILIFGSLLLLLNVVVGIFLRNNNDSVIQSEMESFMRRHGRKRGRLRQRRRADSGLFHGCL